MSRIALRLNGRAVTADVEPRTLLVDLLCETERLTATHVGCQTSQCGACTVLLNGKAIKSCTMLAVEADGHEVVTIEGLAANDARHPMLDAFLEHDGHDCAFCSPGMVLSAVDMLRRKASPSEREIREWLDGNVCRCAAYHGIVKAARRCAKDEQGAEQGGAAE